MKKLIRDNIPEIMEKAGKKCNYYVADEKEFKERLIDKLGEECSELQEALKSGSKDKIVNEFNDVVLVLEFLITEFGIDDTYRLSQEKNKTNGTFNKHYIGVFEDDK